MTLTIPKQNQTRLSHNAHQSPDKTKEAIHREAAKDIQWDSDLLRGHLRQHVVNQEAMILAAVISVLTGLKIYFIGRPGLGKTILAKVLMQALGFKGAYTCLNPEVTPSRILGMRKLDLKTHEVVFVPGIFDRDNHIVFIDELNRASDQAQTAMLEPLSSKQVTVDGISHPTSDILTILAAGNLDEDGGTRPLISAIWDRFDCVVPTAPLTTMSALQVIDLELRPDAPVSPVFGAVYEETRRMNGNRMTSAEMSAEEIIRKHRTTFKAIQSSVDKDTKEAAAFITGAFSDPAEWRIGATYRTATALVNTALALAIVNEGVFPQPEHVWQAARWCLGGLEPRDHFFSTMERLEYIYSRISNLGPEYKEYKRKEEEETTQAKAPRHGKGKKRK